MFNQPLKHHSILIATLVVLSVFFSHCKKGKQEDPKREEPEKEVPSTSGPISKVGLAPGSEILHAHTPALIMAPDEKSPLVVTLLNDELKKVNPSGLTYSSSEESILTVHFAVGLVCLKGKVGLTGLSI
ncbi:MAG: hypothetical protein EOO89_30135 [Pedobacter sp.]|nr:MAG: hypothetical protein EOO89_30135 [Pedobacter sp.]